MMVYLGGKNNAGFADPLLEIGNSDYSNINGTVTVPSNSFTVVITVQTSLSKMYPDSFRIHKNPIKKLTKKVTCR